MHDDVEKHLTIAPLLLAVWTGVLFPATSVVFAADGHEVERMNLEVTRLLAKGWLEDAAELAGRAAKVAESELSEDDPIFLEALSNLAGVRRRSGDRDEARALYEKLLGIQERTLGPDHLDVATSLDDLAGLQRSAHSFEEAESLYSRALRIREQALGPEDPGLVESLTNLAGVYQIQRDYAPARPLLERTIAIQEKTFGPDHPKLLTSLNFIAAVCHGLGERRAAEAFAARADSIRAEAQRLPPADPEKGSIGITVWVNPSVGKALGGKGRMYAAKVYFIRMDDNAEPFSAHGTIWPNYSWSEQKSLAYRATNLVESTFNQTADVYVLNVEPGRYVAVGAVLIHTAPGQTLAYHGYFSTEVISRTEVSVAPGELAYMGDVRATVRGAPGATQRFLLHHIPSNPEPVIDVRGLGAVHYRNAPQWTKLEQFERGGKSEAGFWRRSRRAFKNDTSWLPLIPDRDTVTEPTPLELSKFGELSQRALDKIAAGEYGEAVDFADKAVRTCESIPGAETSCLGAALGNLADLTAESDRAGAKPLYERVLKLREKNLESPHPAIGYSLASLAELSQADGETEDAAGSAKRARDVLEQSLGSDHPAVADLLEFLGELSLAGGDGEQATTLIRQALRIREDALGWTHPTVAPALDFLARQTLAAKEYVDSAELTRRALKIRERFLGEDHPRVADTLFTLGRALHGLKDYEGAVQALERALSIQTAAFGSKHQRVIDTMNSLASCYDEEGEQSKARRLRDQADELAQQKTMEDLGSIGEAIVKYAVDKNEYPPATDIETLRALLQPAYIQSMPTEDGWGRQYDVASSASSYELRSLGKDGRPGGATSNSDADIVYSNGLFTQLPEGP